MKRAVKMDKKAPSLCLRKSKAYLLGKEVQTEGNTYLQVFVPVFSYDFRSVFRYIYGLCLLLSCVSLLRKLFKVVSLLVSRPFFPMAVALISSRFVGVKGLSCRSLCLRSLVFVGCRLSLIVVLCQYSVAQVPAQLQFGDLKIHLSKHARTEIENKMRSLAASKRSLAVKVDRARRYFPLIEKGLEAEGVPLDFKYLVLQESALISDAVSSSNAVGFWQFKDFTAKEVGLRLDRYVDARMHILASTRGAARYLKRNNFYFDNWMYALTAYYAGRGGAQKYVEDKYMGKKIMVISKRNHWYIKTFLAHLLLFKKEMAKSPQRSPSKQLLAYYEAGGQSLRKVGSKFGVPEEQMRSYNKWLRRGSLPNDESLPVIVPLEGPSAARMLAKYSRPLRRAKDTPAFSAAVASTSVVPLSSRRVFVPISQQVTPRLLHQVRINGISAIVAHKHDNLNTLAIKAGISHEKLSWYNELPENHKVRAGQIYYLKRKRRSARTFFHTTEPGQTLWDVAQRYGMRLRSLRRKNRMYEGEALKTGRVLWLRKRRPRREPVAYKSPPLPPKPQKEAPVSSPPPSAASKVSDTAVSLSGSSALHTHIVQEGESAYSIAKQYGLSVMSLLNWNNLKVNEPIHSGEKLQFYTDKVVKMDFISSNPTPFNVPTFSRPAIGHEVASGETLSAIARRYGVSLQDLLRWNGLQMSSSIRPGDKIRIARGTSTRATPPQQPRAAGTKHKVASGETLSAIARRYGVSLQDLLRWNSLQISSPIRPGDKIHIANTGTSTRTTPPQQPIATSTKHEVASGETLSVIARRYGVALQDLLRWNGLEISSPIRPGDRLQVTPTTKRNSTRLSSSEVHIIATGDTFYSLSQRYGIPSELLKKWNNKTNNTLQVGEKIRLRP